MGLQFSWIEANLLRFFLVDIQNSRGKFDEIKKLNRDYHASMDASLHTWKQRIIPGSGAILTYHFRASLNHKDDDQTKFIKPNSQR